MARSVLKAADREANQAREGWMDWLADKAYDVISDAGHRVHVRHHRSASGRMGWAVRDHETGESGSESEAGRGSRRWSRRRSRASSRASSRAGQTDGSDGPKMRGGGERERGGGGSAAWVGGAGEGGGEEAVRVRAKEKGKRRQAQEARRRGRRSSSSDESRRTDSEGRQRMTLREHVADAVHEAKERHAEHKALKAEQEERFGVVRAIDPDDVPLPEGVEPPVTASAVAKDE